MHYKAVLFDMDGTLIDSEAHNLMAAVELFKRQGYEVKAEDFSPFIGGGADKYIRGVAQKYGVKFSDFGAAKSDLYSIYDELIKGNLQPVKGAHHFIARCRAKGMMIALATSADWVKLNSNLREFGATADDFDVVVQGLEVENKKPDPETFLKAAEKLFLSPSECVVFEDAPNGVEAAKAGGFTCVGVMTSFSAAELDKADYLVSDLSQVTPKMMGW